MAGETWGAGGGARNPQHAVPPLAQLTTLRVGGAPRAVVAVDSFEQAAQTLEDLDDAGTAYWPLGGGSNLVVADEGVDAVVVWMRDARVEVLADGDDAVTVNAGAGAHWDDFVSTCVVNGWSGVEALSGIPGTVGAAPLQNIGAYGACVADVLTQVQAWDRRTRTVRTITAQACGFSYRDSEFKRRRMPDGSPADIVLSVQFRLVRSPLSAPVRYAELAAALGVDLGACVDLADVRDAVLRLRRAKGMLLDEADHDTWSVGSFFTNPVVPTALAEALPAGAPRWPVGEFDGAVKLSAAWLVEHAGFPRGFHLPGSQAALSNKHTLAITNRGGATSFDVVELARAVRGGVAATFGVTLEVEPMLLGVRL
ncbi:MAG: UDP-N-acetylmuramate dehydrogenase [Actinomycetales bacterium]|nr:UDP-N-acetylmuramate dehydrogenase [Actinomycetales bacterium]